MARLLQEMGGKCFDYLFEELAQLAPDCFAVSRYRMFRLAKNADKMYASVQGILAANLSPYMFDGARALFQNPQKINFPDLGREKTAVFLTVSDTDCSMDGLANLLYTQALQSLCAAADKSPGHRLAVPVRFILDDFAANTCIPDFDKTISVIRSREISASIILQSLSQLEALYGHAKALTILNNCDHCLYLGGQDVETAQFISKKADKPTSDILNMPLDSAPAGQEVQAGNPSAVPGAAGEPLRRQTERIAGDGDFGRRAVDRVMAQADGIIPLKACGLFDQNRHKSSPIQALSRADCGRLLSRMRPSGGYWRGLITCCPASPKPLLTHITPQSVKSLCGVFF